MYMTQGIQMATQFGDGSQPAAGFFDKVLSAGKRVLTGESLFMTVFSCASSKREKGGIRCPLSGQDRTD
jgi:uncharacterized protein (AIM24 family)